jgi:translation initiation factor 3 subunit F
MSEELSTLELGTYSLMNYRIHPSVPLQMLEFFYRKTSTYMVGTLLGRIESTHVDITDCFMVPFLEDNEDDEEDNRQRRNELIIDKEYHKRMFELNQKVYPKETIVGWFSDLPELNFEAAVIHQFYTSKDSYFTGKQHIFPSPLIVIVDPFSPDNIFGMKAYINQPLSICKETFGVFQQVSLNFDIGTESKNEVSLLWTDKTELKGSEKSNPFGLINLDSVEDLMTETLENIKKLQQYVKDVNEGKEKGSPEIGKAIKKLLNLAPTLQQSQFKNVLDRYMQDVLMVLYLSNLANSQILISEKLAKIA